MATETEIANKALALSGQKGVTNFRTDGTDRANAVDNVYDIILREVLSEGWNFATKRASLASVSVTIPWTGDGLGNAFTYPTDGIRVLDLNDNNLRWRVEVVEDTKVILTDATAPLNCRYIFENLNTAHYTAKFVEAVAFRLSAEIDFQINRSLKEYVTRLEVYKTVVLPDALSSNSQEGTPLQPKQDLFALSKFGNTPIQGINYNG